MLAAALVVVFSIATVAAMIGFWARQTALDTSRFVSTVEPLRRDEAVERALSSYLTGLLLDELDLDGRAEKALPEQLAFLVGPLEAIVRDYAAGEVSDVLRSDRFRPVWIDAVRRAHEGAVAVLEDRADAPSLVDDNGKGRWSSISSP